MTTVRPKQNIELARAFLKLLDEHAQRFTFQTFDDCAPRKGGKLAKIFHGTLDEHWPELIRRNEKGAGVFVTINETDFKGRNIKNITGARSLWQDDDEQFGWKLSCPPSIEVISSPGKYQRLLLTDDISLEQFDVLQRAMVKQWGCCEGAQGRNRVLRLPGTLHMKKPDRPHLVVMTPKGNGYVHTNAELYGHIRPITTATLEKPTRQQAQGGYVAIDRNGENINVLAWDLQNKGYPLAQRLKEVASKIIRKKRTNGGFIIQCPFEQEHTEAGGEGTFIDDPKGDAPWMIFCAHASCRRAKRDRWAYLAQIIRNGDITAADLGGSPAAKDFYDVCIDPEAPNLLAEWMERRRARQEKARKAAESKSKWPGIAVPASHWPKTPPEDARFVVQQLVPRGFVTLLASAGGRGKSMLSLQAMVCVASQKPFLGLAVEQGSAIGFFCEDELDEIRRRSGDICKTLGIDHDSISERFAPTSWVGTDSVLWKDNPDPEKNATDLLGQIEATVTLWPDLRLLVIDNVSFVFAAKEYDRSLVTRFIARLTGIGTKHNVAILLVHHESKTNSDDDINAASGSTAWINACRSVLKLTEVEGRPNERALVHIKTNRGPKHSPMPLEMQGRVFVTRNDSEHQRAARIEALRIVATAIKRGDRISTSKMAAKRYAPRYMHDNQSPAGKFTVEEFHTAIEFLCLSEQLTTRQYKNAKGELSEEYVPGAEFDVAQNRN